VTRVHSQVARVMLGLFLPVAMATAATAGPADPKWEVEVHGGGSFPTTPAKGDVALPPFYSIVTTPLPDSARIVSSWYFGDGAAQFNDTLASLRQFGAIVPLDTLLQSRFAERQAGASVGFRVLRVLNPRFSAEFSFDAANNPLAMTSATIAGIEATRLSFEYAWNSMLTGPAGRAQAVTSTADVDDRRGRRLTTMGSLVVNVAPRGRLTPYVTGGGGVVRHSGGTPSANLTGTYSFVFPPSFVGLPPGITIPTVNVNDEDAVTVRTEVRTRFALAFGGGVKYAIGARAGLRVDIRDSVVRDSQKTLLDATPRSEASVSVSSLAVGSAPRIWFGSSSFIRQTFSGSKISDFETYRGTGLEHDVHLTAGLYWRF